MWEVVQPNCLFHGFCKPDESCSSFEVYDPEQCCSCVRLYGPLPFILSTVKTRRLLFVCRVVRPLASNCRALGCVTLNACCACTSLCDPWRTLFIFWAVWPLTCAVRKLRGATLNLNPSGCIIYPSMVLRVCAEGIQMYRSSDTSSDTCGNARVSLRPLRRLGSSKLCCWLVNP